MTDNPDGHSDTIERTAGHSPDEIVAPRQRIRNITELARLAGVSPGTVSRALAGKSLVNPQTRDRIQALAREHGFRLNPPQADIDARRQ